MNLSKDIESHIIQLLNRVLKEDLVVNKYSKTAIKIYNYITEEIMNSEYSEPYKPKIKGKPVYSERSGEPKTDVVLPCTNFTFRFTIKENYGAYIVSCNSPKDFITQFIDIHNGKDVLDVEMIEILENVAKCIKKIANFYSYDGNYKKDNNIEGFVKDKFQTKALKYATKDNVIKFSNYIIECYNNPDKQNEYISNLHELESYVQKSIITLFKKYPDYAKRIIFELLTGNIKFNNNLCSANYLASSDGVFKLDNYNCEYVNIIYNKFLNNPRKIRLQNVPRKSITKKVLLTNDLELIANNFSVADLTFKM